MVERWGSNWVRRVAGVQGLEACCLVFICHDDLRLNRLAHLHLMSLFEHLNMLVKCLYVIISLADLLLVLADLVLELLYLPGLMINQPLLTTAYVLTSM
jgi:hypothetical protein